MSKAAKITIVFVLAILLILGIVGLIFILKPQPQPENILTDRLSTPKNLTLDQENWILSYGKVDNAERYEIFINNFSFITDKTTVNVSRYIDECGMYTFQVRALYSIASLNSFKSDAVFGYKYDTLSTPVNLSWDDQNVLYWSYVKEAKSYNILIKFADSEGNISEDSYITEDIKFNFNSLLTQLPYSELSFFTVQVQASSTDGTGITNPYIKNSEFSEEQVYYKVSAIDTPTIYLNMSSNQQTADKLLTWNTDFAVEEYIVYVDGNEVKRISSNEFLGQSEISINLKDVTLGGVHIADTLGEHNAYIIAVPKTNEYYTILSQTSNSVSFKITHKLSNVDINSIHLYKEGGNLVITWDPVVDNNPYSDLAYEPTYYNLIIWANANPEVENSQYVELSPVTQLITTKYTKLLSELEAYGKDFKVQIQAVRENYEYVLSSDYSEMSSSFSAVSRLKTPDNLVLSEGNGVYNLTWRAVDEAQAGYLVNIYNAENVDGVIVIATSPIISQVVTETKMQISDYMNALGLLPGTYGVQVITLGSSIYYIDSLPSKTVGFDYKVRLNTPVIESITRAEGTENKRNVTITWSYVPNAQKYYININNIDAVVVDQPQYVPESGYLSETTLISQYINSFDQPNQYKITVQAVVTENLSNISYVNSLPSRAVTFVNTYKHETPANMYFTQKSGENKVTLEWDEVKTVTLSSGRYNVLINDVLVTDADSHLNKINDISPYLKLGYNEIKIYCAGSGQLYTESNILTDHYTYYYTLTGSSNLEFSLADNQKIEILIPGFNRYVTNYYLVFSNGKTLSVATERDNEGNPIPGADARALVGFETLPLFTRVDITIYAGKIDVANNQTYMTPCSWTQSFINNLYMASPSITFNNSTYEATISVPENSLTYTKSIEWRLTGTTGVNYNAFITDFSQGSTFRFNLKDMGLINEGDLILVGTYNLYAVAISNQVNNVRSQESTTTFTLTRQLANPINFIQADDNTYLQWDAVLNADSYEVLVNNSAITPNISEISIPEGSSSKMVIRLDTTQILQTSGSYVFKIKALANSDSFYESNTDYATYTWNFNNQLNAPSVSIVDYDGDKQLAIFYNSLVKNYTITCTQLSLNTTINAVSVEGYVYYNIEMLLTNNNALAGEYTFKVVANPKNIKYTSSNATEVKYVWQKQFATPEITVTQDFDADTMIIDWQDIQAEMVGGVIATPRAYRVTISTTSGTVIVNNVEITESQYIISGSTLLANDSEYYFVDVCALAQENSAMIDGYSNSVKFAYQKRLAKPVITTAQNSLIDDQSITVNATGLDNNVNQLDLLVELIDSTGNVASTKTFNNISWNSSTFAINGNEHITERGIYRITVRNVQNKQYATSAWSEPLYIYYGKSFNVADNIVVSIDESNQVTVTFNKLSIPSLASVLNYSASISYLNGSTHETDTKTITGIVENSFSFAGDEGWSNALSTQLSRISISITANTQEIPCSPSDLGLATFNFAPSSTTNYVFTIGAMNTPSDITLTANGKNISISWKGDPSYSSKTYVYSISLINGRGQTTIIANNSRTTNESVDFVLPRLEAYIINFKIQSESGIGLDKVTSAEETKVFVNTQDLGAISDFDINYDGVYKATWTHVLPNITAFDGAQYVLTLNGEVFNIDNSSLTFSNGYAVLTMTEDMINAALSAGRTASWAIKTNNITYTSGDDTLIAYKGNVSVGNVSNVPVIISDAPEILKIVDSVASWSAVTFATKYQVYVSLTAGGDVLDDRSVTISSISYDISNLIAGLDAGVYYIVVKVAEDVDKKIYVSTYVSSKSVSYINKTPADGVSNLTLTTMAAINTYATTITWYYKENAKFSIYLTNSNGDASTVAERFGAGSYSLTYSPSAIHNNYGTYTFNYLDGSNNDPTRKMTAGDYILSVVACGSGYNTDSAPVNHEYKNKFALTSISDESLFTIAPDCYIGDNSYATDLAKYENAYGMNTKFLVINNSSLSYATHFNVYVLDNDTDNYVWAGKIKNEQLVENGAKLTFDILSASSNKITLSKIIAGRNTIKLVPYGDENYYFYIENNVEYTLSQAEENIQSIFDVDLHLREEAPLLNALSIDVRYTDSPTNTNVNKMSVVFRNAKVGATYRVTPYYYDSYDNGTEKQCESFDVTLTEADFENGIPLGIQVFDKIKHYGPHAYFFEVQTLSSGEYYLDSFVSKTENTAVLKTRLVEFAPYSRNGDPNINSLVTEVTEDNADEIAKNGSLYWTLPKHAYSISVKYTVTMVDKSQSDTMLQFEKHTISYSAYLIINVSADGSISYGIEQGETIYFVLDPANNRIIFDMRAYFENKNRIKNATGDVTGTYYLAGTYEYMIEALALGIDKEPVDGVVYSPNKSYGSLSELMPYTYQGIAYPNKPQNINLTSKGILSWSFNDEIYGTSAEHFGIVIRNYEAEIDGTEQEYIEFIKYVDNEFSLDINQWLIAGGGKRNEVFIFTVKPNDYYYNSEWVKVDATKLESSSTLPTVGINWDDHREITAVLVNDISESVYSDIVNNDYNAWIEVSLLKLSNWKIGDELPLEGANYDTVKANNPYTEIVWNMPSDSDFYNYITYYRGMTNYNFNLVSEINFLADNGKIANIDTWLSAKDSLSGGYYYIKVSLVTSSPYYSASVVTSEKLVREVWRSSVDGADISGQYLTTKTTTTAAQPIAGYDRIWGEQQFKQANLSFYVQTIQQKIDGVTYYRLPSTITVTARLYLGLNYDTNNYYTHTYNIPDPSNFGTSDVYCDYENNADVMISRCFMEGSTSEIDYSKVKVTIDIHLLFDANINAGVYHIFWVLDGDAVGDSSPTADPYKLSKEVCHYVILPTPILDYRLDYTGTNSSQFVINWILTPDKYTYTVNESCKYNVNLFAFEEINGEYAIDKLYNSLSADEKLHFLDSENQIKYFANNSNTASKLLDSNQDYFLNGRQCYIYQPTTNFSLTPNKNYKLFIYLSQKDWTLTGDKNDLYYLNSDTSVGVEYMYKKVSGIHSNTSINPTIDEAWPVENTVNMENNSYYTLVSDQPDNYNNAFEFYVYNTQDPEASTNREWMKNQELQGTYLAHWIIGTRNNAFPSDGNSEDLYILYDYEDRIPNSGRWAVERSVGMIDSEGHITLNELTLSELLQNKRIQGMEEELNKVLVPINYYCRIKTWINNNSINKNAPIDDAGYYEDDVIYSKKWIRAHLPYVIDENGNIDETMVDNFYNMLNEKQFTIEYLDMNILNPSLYFSFRHKIQYAEPGVSYIEILNKDGSSDYVNYSSLGATDGYVIADSDSGYYYKIWLENVYTEDPLIINDKLIEMTLGYTFYSEQDGGSSGTGAAGNEWNWTDSVLFNIHYVSDKSSADYGKAYIILAIDSAEAGASEMFTTLDERLPNVVSIKLKAVTNQNRMKNDGGLNTANEFLKANYNGVVLSAKDKIDRIYVDSIESLASDYISIHKQYTAPEVTLMFDTMQPILSNHTENLQKLEVDGKRYKTNLIESGDYVGLATNPYIYTTKNTLMTNGGQYFEYGMLKTDRRTNYLITLNYRGLDSNLYTKQLTILTYDVNRTCILQDDVGEVIGGAFYNEVNGKDTDEARFNYNTYQDIYNYVTTCLYKAMYDLINEADNTPTSSGNYHGGLISIDIQTVAPSLSVAPNNLWVSSNTRTGYELYFYSRLETVKTNFQENLSECSFDTYSEYGMPSFYTHVGQYFYYHSYIPYHYESISRDVKYNIYLSREGNMSYDIYNSKVKNACTIQADSGKKTNSWNIKNLTDILKIDLGDPSVDKANYNQWRLPDSDKDRWHMNIVAVVDDTMSYVGRGFNSKDLYYIVKLKIKNDIESLGINMASLANQSTGKVAQLNASTLLSTTNGVLYNYKTSSDSSNYTNSACLPYNGIVTHARLYYYYPYKKSNMAVSKWFPIDQSQGTRYYLLLSDFINQIFVQNPEIRGSDNFKLYIQFHYEKPNNLWNSYIVDSNYTIGLPFNYYRQLEFDTSQISFSQSGNSIYMSAKYSVNNQFSALKVTIDQYDLNNRLVRTSISTGNSGSSMISYWARGDFSYNNSDAFDTRSRSSSEINDMISGYKTAYTGYVQGGLNQFTVTPIHDGYEKEHNLLTPGISHNVKRVNFTIGIHPSATISHTTAVKGDENKVISEKWQWQHDNSTTSNVEKKVEYGESYGYIDSISTSFSNMKACSMKATWTYRFDIDDSVINTATLDGFGTDAIRYKNMRYGDVTGSTTDTSNVPKVFPKEANYFSMTIITYCKPGFSSVFSGGGTWSASDSGTAKAFVGKRVKYEDRTSMLNFITEAKVTSGHIGRGSVGDYLTGGFKGGNRACSGTVVITMNAPSHLSSFRIKVAVRAVITCSNSNDLITRTANISASSKALNSTGDTSFSCSGSYWETDPNGCLANLTTFNSGYAYYGYDGRA